MRTGTIYIACTSNSGDRAMDAASYLREVASELGLYYVDSARTFDRDPIVSVVHQAGCVLGARAGYPVAISIVKVGRSTQLAILIRHKTDGDDPLLSTAVKEAFDATKLLSSKSVKVKPGRILLQWGFTFKKPPQEEVASTLDAVVAAIGPYAQPFSGKCESCGQSVGEAIVLMNDVPCYMCAGCQQRMIDERQREADAYAARDMQLPKAFVLTTLAAAAGAFALAWFYFWIEKDGTLPIKVVFVLPGILGALTGWVFAKSVGRIAFRLQALPLFLLGSAAAFAACVGYGALYNSQVEHVPVTLSFLIREAGEWLSYHAHGGGLWMVAGYVVSGIGSVGLLKSQEPKFAIEFVSLADAAVGVKAVSA